MPKQGDFLGRNTSPDSPTRPNLPNYSELHRADSIPMADNSVSKTYNVLHGKPQEIKSGMTYRGSSAKAVYQNQPVESSGNYHVLQKEDDFQRRQSQKALLAHAAKLPGADEYDTLQQPQSNYDQLQRQPGADEYHKVQKR